ncbi:hypothetical protein NDU88_007184 [Pleurodeles waltl]|uniref:Uncharacterized protein n=1 Tax=Pleurodeles waltl TaxID=8319 RepID=A0AAV7N2Q9_PLEWA|nr:hypothetical protein NDU88_007184 [Pleurodeles waltl]
MRCPASPVLPCCCPALTQQGKIAHTPQLVQGYITARNGPSPEDARAAVSSSGARAASATYLLLQWAAVRERIKSSSKVEGPATPFAGTVQQDCQTRAPWAGCPAAGQRWVSARHRSRLTDVLFCAHQHIYLATLGWAESHGLRYAAAASLAGVTREMLHLYGDCSC